MKLDYTIQDPQERLRIVEDIVNGADAPLTPTYLEILADYLVLCMEKQEKKERNILTENRLLTVNKRECSFEGLSSQFENGEDGLYPLVNENKNAILTPKLQITEEDLKNIPPLRQLREAIKAWEELLKESTGKKAYTIKKALIEMRKDQYIIKQAYTKPISCSSFPTQSFSYLPLDDFSYMRPRDLSVSVDTENISLMNPRVCSAILCNYSRLKQDSYDNFRGDLWYLLADFDLVSETALEQFPIYQAIVELKIDGVSNAAIQQHLQKQFGLAYCSEYISKLWRNKIPRLIAIAAQEQFIEGEFKRRGLPMKKCTRCGKLKPAHNLFFSKNNDGFYSICKACRNHKGGT